jgi:hypothetical protein
MFSAQQKRRGQPFLQFHTITAHFYVVDSYISANNNNNNNNRKGTYCCISVDTVVTRTRRNVTCMYTVCLVPINSQSSKSPVSGFDLTTMSAVQTTYPLW